MNAETYCKNNPRIGFNPLDYYTVLYLHGVEYGVDDYVYVSIQKGKNDPTYHRFKLRYSTKGPYFRVFTPAALPLPRIRVYIDEFIKYVEVVSKEDE